MPSRVNNGTMSPSSPRFELPALNLDLGNITDGTDIPPPPKSPVEKPASKPAKKEEKPKATSATDESEKTDGPEAPAVRGQNGNIAGTKRPADDMPPSSGTLPDRQGSLRLRRLLSGTFLNNSYAEGQLSSGSRPPSRGGSSFMDERKSKRSSGWFKRLRGGDSKRSSLIFEQGSDRNGSISTPKKPSGPPPPMIPELKDLEKDEGSLGGDLFKNIK